jgi:hypothetical protein
MKYLLALSLSTILLVVGIAGFRYYRSQNFGRPDAGVHGALAHAPFDLLLIGSSHTYLSYDVAALQRDVHAPIYLIGYNALDLSLIAPVIKYLSSNPAARPKEIVIEAYSSNLGRPPTMSDSRLYFESPPELKRLIVSGYFRQHRGLSAFTEMFDLVVNRGNEAILAYPISSKWGGRNTYRGGGIVAAGKGVSAERFASFRPHLSVGIANPGQLEALQEIIDATRRAGIHVMFIESPMPGPVSRSAPIRSLKKVFREKLEQEKLPYLDGDTVFPIDDPEYFEDDNHLSSVGRTKFTAIVAKYIVAHRYDDSTELRTASNR